MVTKYKILNKKFNPKNGGLIDVSAFFDGKWMSCVYYRPDEFQLGCSHLYKQGFIYTFHGNSVSVQVPKGVKQIKILQHNPS